MLNQGAFLLNGLINGAGWTCLSWKVVEPGGTWWNPVTLQGKV